MKTWNLKIQVRLIFVVSLLASTSLSWAQAPGNQSLVYQGRIVRPDGNVPNLGNLTFTLSIYSPAPGSCLLYSEIQTVNMTGSEGMFTLNLGEGTRTDGGSHSFASVFVNGQTLTGLSCSVGNTYTATATDDRNLRVSFNDNGTIVSLSARAIKSVPFALQAHQIDGWGLNNLVKVSNVSSPTTFTTDELAKVKSIGALGCAANEVLKWNGSSWACAADSTGGALGDAGYGAAKGVVAFETDVATSGISVSSGVAKLSNTGVSAGTYGAAGSVSQVVVDTQGRVTSALEVPIQISSNQISVSGGTLGQVLKWNGSAWLPDADLGISSESDPMVQGFAKNAPSARFVTSGSVLDLAVIPTVSAGTYGSGTQVPVFTVDAFGRVTAVTNTAITGASPVGAALNAAQFWVGDGSNLAAAVSLSGDAALFNDGALTINKLQGQTLTLAANPGAGALLTFNTSLARWEALALPDCTASETLGFNAVSGNYECQAINNATNFTGSLVGDVTGPQGSTTLSRLRGQSLQISSLAARDTLVYNGSAWVNANIPSCAANQYLTFNGSYFCVTDTGSSGLVTSVDVAVPSFLSTSGGPITTSGTISLGLQNQNANLVFAGPASGGAAAPSFRSLVADDIPDHDAAKISSGTLSVSRGGTGSGAALTNNKVMVSSGGAIVEGEGFGSAKANNTYVVRDGSGGFAAGAVTVDSTILKGAISGSLTLQAPVSVTSYTLTLPSAVGSAGQVLATDASGNLSWAAAGSANSFVQDGNSFGVPAVLGTNDNNSLNFETAGITQMTIDSSGNVGIGTTSPAFKLSLSGTASLSDRKIGINGLQMMYLPDQSTLNGSIFFGNGGQSLSQVNAWEGKSNTGVGVGALALNTTGYVNTAIGRSALYTNTTGYENTATGMNALYYNTTGHMNAAYGFGALYSNTSGYENIAVGPSSLRSNTTGAQNSAVGKSALYSNTTGILNTAMGMNALYFNTTGNQNAAFGYESLWYNQAKSQSTAIGYRSMYYADNTTTAATSYNTAIGAFSLRGSATPATNTGTMNTALGYSALQGMTAGSRNIGIGYNSGSAITTGSNNIVIGSDTGADIATLSNYILISDGAGTRRLTIDPSGNVGLGTTVPASILDINGAETMRGMVAPALSSAGQGRIYFDSTANKYKVSENGGAYTDLVSSGGGGISGSGTANYLPRWTSGTAIGNSEIYSDGAGRIGLGTTAPSYKLEVAGNTTSQFGQKIVNSNAASSAELLLQAGDGGAIVYGQLVANMKGGSFNGIASGHIGLTAAAGHPIGFANGSTQTMTISSSGNVGIGTLSPSFKLELTGTSSPAVRKMGINGTQVLYLPDQLSTAFTGSILVGNGGTSLSHSTGWEGYYNTGVGIGALALITTGFQNTAQGNSALYSITSGWSNSAFGASALYSNTTGNWNSAFGKFSLYSSTTGGANTATGDSSLFYNTTGSNNTASGFYSLYWNKAKQESTAIGYHSMYYADSTTTTSVSFNTAVGAYSLLGSTTAANNTGTQNTAIGHSALKGMTSGSGNIGLGYNAGSAITTGSNNVVIGSDTGAGIATSSNNILISDGAGNRRITIDSSGNVGIGTISPSQKLDVNGTVRAVDVVVTSDRRAKRQITSLDPDESLRKICSVRPVSFDWKHSGKRDSGFIAQELMEIFPEFVIENNDGSYSVKYQSIIAPLLSSVQSLNQKLENEKTKNQVLENKILRLEESQKKLEEKLNRVLRELEKR